MVWTADVHRPVVRRGRVAWLTHPSSGTGRVESESRAFGVMPVTLPKGNPVRAQAAPGELLAVAHAMFMAAALSEALALVGLPPTRSSRRQRARSPGLCPIATWSSARLMCRADEFRGSPSARTMH
jgi:hypothetical protein